MLTYHCILPLDLLSSSRKLRRQQQMKLLMQLSFAWTGALVSFLIGGQLAPFPKACAAFAVFIHYFLLVVFMWTLVQAVFLYISLVKVYAEGTKALFKKAIIGCWSKCAGKSVLALLSSAISSIYLMIYLVKLILPHNYILQPVCHHGASPHPLLNLFWPSMILGG